MHRTLTTLMLLAGIGSYACYTHAQLSPEQTTGASPVLPKPEKNLIPTVNIAPAKGWPDKQTPLPSIDLEVTAFAGGLDHPRWLYVLPNGDVLMAEANAPAKEKKGLRAWVMGVVMKRAGAATPSANRISLFRDSDNDGIADIKSVFLDGLNSPFGMTLVDDKLYIANTDAVISFPYRTDDTRINAPGTKLVSLPAGEINHHWTKNIIASPDGSKLYVTIGSNSNVGESGMEVEKGRAAIWEIDRATGSHRIFASGLRNPNGMAWEQDTGALWTVVNERDELGDDLVPDYLTSVQNGGFYGWPYSYYGQHVDTRVEPQRPDLVAKAIVPDYSLGSHVAPLGLASAADSCLLPAFARGMFVSMHGSWNRKILSGYKVVFVPFVNGKPAGLPVDVLTGFVNDKGEALGRPVGLAIDKKGALLVADDVGNIVWRVSSKISGAK